MIAESITAFVAVVDRLIQLTARRELLNRNTFTDFVAPVMTDFEAVHKNYLDSFRRYHAALADSAIPITEAHPIFKDINRDIILSRSLIYKAMSLRDAQNIRLQQLASQVEDYFQIPADSLLAYQTEPVDSPLGYEIPGKLEWVLYSPRTNVFRSVAIEMLHDVASGPLSDEAKRKWAVEQLDAMLEALQARYWHVLSAYNTLKIQILTPV